MIAAVDVAKNARLVRAICNASFLDDLPRGSTANPYPLIDEIVTKADDHVKRGKPLAESGIDTSISQLHALLSDALVQVQHDDVTRTLKALRSVRRYDDLAVMADRFVTRDPSMLGLVSSSYAQGLIDSGRVVAGIEVLHAALENATLTKTELEEVNGLLGRGHKQIYVNHVRSASDAAVLGDPMTGQLKKATDSYRRHYDPAKPGDNHYQSINYIALLKRAERDRVDIGANVKAENLARAMITALEPGAEKSDDAWTFGSLGEAYLAIGDHENAARWFGAYARHKDIDGFKLNSTVRQLEEVWQLKAGPKGANAIVAGLKAALVRADNGQLRLDVEERRALANAEHIDHQAYFETKTSGGRQIKLADLQQIVKCAAAVVAVQSKKGGSSTVGTGFLMQRSSNSTARWMVVRCLCGSLAATSS